VRFGDALLEDLGTEIELMIAEGERSTPSAPNSSTICAPLATPERTEGERKSPPTVVMVLACRARS
jgi:hypothetical protein